MASEATPRIKNGAPKEFSIWPERHSLSALCCGRAALAVTTEELLSNFCLGLDNLDSISTRVAHVKAVCTRYG